MIWLPSFLIYLFLFALGAALGSFVNVVIYRSIKGQSWVKGFSKCDFCSKPLNWYDNIPLLSFALLGGKSRDCGKRLSLTHPAVELGGGALLVAWYWLSQSHFLLAGVFAVIQPAFWLVVGLILLMIVVADLRYMIIPDGLVVGLLGLTLLYRISLVVAGLVPISELIAGVIVTAVIFAFFAGLWLMTGGRGMGLGDVKLVLPLGLLLGWPGALVGIFLAFIIGAVISLGLLATQKKHFGQTIPFGPFLVLGAVIALLFSDELIGWYLGLMGF